MTLNFAHFALYYSAESIRSAQEKQENEDFKDAWAQLFNNEPDSQLQQLLWSAYRYRFLVDNNTVTTVINTVTSNTLWIDDNFINAIQSTLFTAHLFEMTRDHDSWSTSQSNWLEAFQVRMDQLLTHETDEPLEKVWQITGAIVAGVVLEDESLIKQGQEKFHTLIDNQIHAEGYLKFAVKHRRPDAFIYQDSAVQALVLAAEAAHHIGIDLWGYESRGVGLPTAVAYQVYYYFFPEKWRWLPEDTPEEQHLNQEFMEKHFNEYGAYVEIAQARSQPRNGLELVMERRPMFSVLAGYTTLSHGTLDKKKKRWRLFG